MHSLNIIVHIIIYYNYSLIVVNYSSTPFVYNFSDFSGTAMDDNEFVTPPSSPPPSTKTVPLIGTGNFSLNQTEAHLSSHHFELTRPGFQQKSYIAYVANSSENGKLMAMLLCEHIKNTRNSPKILIVVNTFGRAWQLHAELKELLPLGDIKCITGEY